MEFGTSNYRVANVLTFTQFDAISVQMDLSGKVDSCFCSLDNKIAHSFNSLDEKLEMKFKYLDEGVTNTRETLQVLHRT